jgi:hypothetical protein
VAGLLISVFALGVTLFECGDSSPLSVVSCETQHASAKRETTQSGEESPHSKKVRAKQQKPATAAKHRRSP